MGHDDESGDMRPRKLIFETRERVQYVRDVFWEEQSNGGVSEETLIDLGTVALQYRDVLSEYAAESALDPPWEERNVDWILNYAGQRVRSQESLPRHGAPAKAGSTKPALASASPWELLETTKRLDGIAKDLGFAAAAKKPTPSEEASMSDLRGLLKSRGQDQALEFLPDSGDEGEAVVDGGEE